MKKISSILLALLISISCFSVNTIKADDEHNWQEPTYEWVFYEDQDYEGYKVTATAECDGNNGDHEAHTETEEVKAIRESYTSPTTTQEGVVVFSAGFENHLLFEDQAKTFKIAKTPTDLNWRFQFEYYDGTWSEVAKAYGYQVQVKWEKDGQSKLSEPSPTRFNEARLNYGNYDIFPDCGEGAYQFKVRTIANTENYPDYFPRGEWSDWSESKEFKNVSFKKVVVDKKGNLVSSVPGSLYVYDNNVGTSVCNDATNLSETHLLVSGKEYGLEVDGINPGFIFTGYDIDTVKESDLEATFVAGTNKEIIAYFEKDDSLSTITVEFGNSHEDVAASLKNKISSEYSPSVNGSVLTFNWPKASAKESSILEYLFSLIQGTIVDDGLTLYEFGKKEVSQYSDYQDFYNEMDELYETDLGDSLELFALWFKKPTVAAFDVEAPKCKAKINYVQKTNPEGCNPFIDTMCELIIYQENAPVVKATKDSHFDLYDSSMFSALWLQEKNLPIHNYILDGAEVEAGESYIVGLNIYPKFGYLPLSASDISQVTATINKEAAEIYNPGAYQALLASIKADHDWEFKGIEWSKTDNVHFAKATYKCNICGETQVVDLQVDNEDPKHITATISKDDALDGIAREEKIARVYNLYVEGIHINGDNCDDILEDGGSVKFDPASATLTLTDAIIDVARREYGDDKNEYGIRSYLPNGDAMIGGTSINEGLTINLVGENTIENFDCSDDTKNVYGIWYNANLIGGSPFTKITGSGSLYIDIYAYNEGPDSYNGIFGHSPLQFDGVRLFVNMPGDEKAIGLGTLYKNPVKLINNANVRIRTGENAESYSFSNDASDNKELSVEKGSIFEAYSENKAFKNINVDDETRELGAFVSEEYSKDTSTLWDKVTDLNTYKYVLIPGEYFTLRFRFSAIDGLDKVDPIEVSVKPNTRVYESLGYDEDDQNIYFYDPLFELEGYQPAGNFEFYRTTKPYTEYTSEEQIEEDSADYLLIQGDTDVYCLMDKEIDYLSYNIVAPNEGERVDMQKDEDGEWDTATATNYPIITDISDKAKEGMSVWAIPTSDEKNPYDVFVGEFEAGKKYLALSYFTSSLGYTFSKDVVIETNGNNIMKQIFFGSVVSVVEIEANKSPYHVEEEKTIDVWYKGSNMNGKFVFKRNINDELTFGSFIGIELDGKPVSEDQYKAYEGSVVIEIYPKYLESLSVGEHTLTALFEDGKATCKFRIIGSSPVPIPKTGIE